MRKSVLAIIALMILSTPLFGQTWTWQNPLPQGNTLYGTQSLNGTTAIAVGDAGTILRTTNNGVNWSRVASGTDYQLSAVCFVDANVGYVVGSEGIILKTINGGTSWVTQRTETQTTLWAVHFFDVNVGCAVGGATSTLASVVVWTTDGGTTWTTQSAGTSNTLRSVFLVSASTAYAVGVSGTVLISTNGGSTWNAQSAGTPNTLFSVRFVNAALGWIAGDGGIILRTTNGGSTWGTQTSGSFNTLQSLLCVDASTVYCAGGFGTLLKTTNGGVAWTTQSSGTFASMQSVHYFDALKGIAVGELGTILTTTNGGSTWTGRSNGTTGAMKSVFFFSPNLAYVVGDMGTVLKTTNGGATWTDRVSGVSNLLQSVFFTDANTGYAVGDGGAIIKTTNGGADWVAEESGVTEWLFGTYFLPTNSGNLGYAVGYNGTILKTENGGTSWAAQVSGTTRQLASVVFLDPLNGFIGGGDSYGANGAVLRTTDGGTSWTTAQVFPAAMIWSITFTDASTGYACGSDGLLLKSTNGGSTWSPLVSNTTAWLYSIWFATPLRGYAVGDGGTVVMTTDAGNTWLVQSSTTVNQLNAARFDESGIGYVVGGGGTILKGTPDPLPHVSLSASTLSFGSVFVSASHADSIEVRSTGMSEATLSSIISTNAAEFSVAESAPVHIAAGSSAIIHLTFHPAAPGSRSGLVIFAHTGLDSPDTLTVTGTGVQDVAVSVPLLAGWNMIANPVQSSNDSVRVLYPGSLNGYAFAFVPGAGYVQDYTLDNGKGYWEKFPSATTQQISGLPRTRDSVSVSAGWNMVGTLSANVDTGTIISIPTGIRASNWFGYAGGYAPATTLAAGKAYWVKANAAGRFVLASSATIAKTAAAKSLLDVLNSITLTDAQGNSQTLYFGADADPGAQMYIMPPLPPSGAFDARFTTADGGTMVQTHSPGAESGMEFPIRLQSEAYPVTVRWNVSKGTTGYQLLNDAGGNTSRKLSMNGEGSLTMANSAVTKLSIRVSGESALPGECRLQQNYPNPFNPATTIRFALPVESRIVAEIFNVIGQRVRVLVNERMAAGYHAVEWDGRDDAGRSLASGVYFLRLSATGANSATFNAVNKLVMMK